MVEKNSMHKFLLWPLPRFLLLSSMTMQTNEIESYELIICVSPSQLTSNIFYIIQPNNYFALLSVCSNSSVHFCSK